MLQRADIILPCFSPNTRWFQELEDFYSYAGDKYNLQFIIVDDGSNSPALTAQIIGLQQKKIPLEYVSYQQNRGKGYALRAGVERATANIMAYTDIDFPFTNKSTLSVLDALAQGNCDVVAGYREHAYYSKKMSGFRKLLSQSFRFFLKRILKLPVSDTQCGLKGFNEKGKLQFLTTTIDRYLFDFEFIYTSAKNKSIRLVSVPVELKDNVLFSKMRLKILLQESVNLIKVLFLK